MIIFSQLLFQVYVWRNAINILTEGALFIIYLVPGSYRHAVRQRHLKFVPPREASVLTRDQYFSEDHGIILDRHIK